MKPDAFRAYMDSILWKLNDKPPPLKLLRHQILFTSEHLVSLTLGLELAGKLTD